MAAQSFFLVDARRDLSVAADIAAMKGCVAVLAHGVAVLAHGKCDIVQKVIHMQDGGVVGAIGIKFGLYGTVANMTLNGVKKRTAEVTIPAVIVSYNSWNAVVLCRNDTNAMFRVEGEA